MARERGKTGKVEKTDAGNSSKQADVSTSKNSSKQETALKRGKTGVIGKQSGREGSLGKSSASSEVCHDEGADASAISSPEPRKSNRALIFLAAAAVIAVTILLYLHSVRTNPEGTPEATQSVVAPKPPAEPYTPPTVVDKRYRHFVNRKSGYPRVTDDQTSRLPMLEHEEDFKAVVSVLMDVHDGDTVRHEAAELLRRSGYDSKTLMSHLKEILDRPYEDARFRGWAVQHMFVLAKWDEEKQIFSDAVKQFHKRLDDRDFEVRREALWALVRLKEPDASETVLTWLRDPAKSGIRYLTIRSAKELDLKDAIPDIRKYAYDKDTTTRIAALVVLSKWGDNESRSAMEAAANLPNNSPENERLRRCGKMALERLNKAAAKNESGKKRQASPTKNV